MSSTQVITMRLRHWDAFIYGLVAPNVHSGSLAEQFGTLCDIGFDTGVCIATEWHQGRLSENVNASAEDLMNAVRQALRASRLVTRFDTAFSHDDRLTHLSVTTRVVACQQSIYAENWAFDSTADHRFLEQIEQGIPLNYLDSEGEEYFDEELKRLHSRDGVVRTSPVYWYILGIVKGALCWFLSDRGMEPLVSAGEVRPTVVLQLLPSRTGSMNSEAKLVFPREQILRANERDQILQD